jgi:hypothetical protein
MAIRALRIAAWLLLAAIVAITLVPGELRPVSGGPVQFERLGAFLALGIAFGLGYPAWPLRMLGLVCLVAVGSEFLQEIVPSRHAVGMDAALKMAGATIGLGLGWFAVLIRRPRASGARR